MCEELEFRYSTRKEYEEEIMILIANEIVDEEYENLIEEYMRFCEANKA